MTLQRASFWTAVWISLSMLIAGGIYYQHGVDTALVFLSGYTVEKLLSFDNLFMFYVIFNYFKVSEETQARALNWGIIGALILRGSLIFCGSYIVNIAPVILYGFGAFLVYSGVKIFFSSDEDQEESPEGLRSKIKKIWPGMPYFLLLIAVIEITDLFFALDSIPAIFGITTNPYLIIISNLSAILGLRSMYFVMLGLIQKFHYLPVSVGAILAFIGVKMLTSHMISISINQTFAFIGASMGIGLLASIIKEKKQC